MFRSATIKLTLLYLTVIMLISVFFSVNLYRISVQEVERSVRRDQKFFQGGGRMMQPLLDTELSDQLEEQVSQAQESLIVQLTYTNIVILVLAGGLSYIFAHWTIRPIEEAHEKQKRFTADASHELRTPLAAMKAEIEVVLRDKKSDKKELTQILSSNLEEVEKMQQLVSGLLSLARDEEAKLVLEVLNPRDIVEEVCERYRKIRGAKIENTVTENLSLKADKTYFTELMSILIDNAIKYSDGKIEVMVRAMEHSKQLEIQVVDHGVGITEQDLPHIFDRFYRADQSRTKNRVDGYGLGLSLAKKIVDLHKGTISVSSEQGKGSTFSIRLPL